MTPSNLPSCCEFHGFKDGCNCGRLCPHRRTLDLSLLWHEHKDGFVFWACMVVAGLVFLAGVMV